MKNTNSKKKITIEINGEKITASKGFFADYVMLLFENADQYKETIPEFSDIQRKKAHKIFDTLDATGYFNDVREKEG